MIGTLYNPVTCRWEILDPNGNLIAEAETQWHASQIAFDASSNALNPYVEPLVTSFVAPSQAALDQAVGSDQSLPPPLGPPYPTN